MRVHKEDDLAGADLVSLDDGEVAPAGPLCGGAASGPGCARSRLPASVSCSTVLAVTTLCIVVPTSISTLHAAVQASLGEEELRGGAKQGATVTGLVAQGPGVSATRERNPHTVCLRVFIYKNTT